MPQPDKMARNQTRTLIIVYPHGRSETVFSWIHTVDADIGTPVLASCALSCASTSMEATITASALRRTGSISKELTAFLDTGDLERSINHSRLRANLVQPFDDGSAEP